MVISPALFFAYVCLCCLVNTLVPRRFRYIWLLACSWFFVLYTAGDLPATVLSMLPENLPANLLAGLPSFLLGRLPEDLAEALRAVPAQPLGVNLPRHLLSGLLAGWPALALLLGGTLAGWLCGLFIEKSASVLTRRLLLAAALLGCLGLLAACKYLGLFGALAALAGGRGNVAVTGLLLPLGVSYYMLTSAGYALDVYARRCPAQRNFARYALFVCFFPALFAGPVGRGSRLQAQLAPPAPFEYKRLAGGAFRMLWGLFKLSVPAGSILLFARSAILSVSAAEGSAPGPALLLAVLLLPWGVYYGFAGCCDVALGAARMLGIDLAEPFARPFAARSFAGLWQRWQMPLLGLLRDAVFFPLAGLGKKRPPNAAAAPEGPAEASAAAAPDAPVSASPAASEASAPAASTAPALFGIPLAQLLAALALFLAFALWHAASLQFLLWGASVALVLCLARLFAARKQRIAAAVPLYRARHLRGFFQRIFVYLLFCGCLVFFASGLFGLPAWGWLGGLFSGWGGLGTGFMDTLAAHGLPLACIITLAAALLLIEGVEHFAVRPGDSVAHWVRRRRFFVRWPLYYLLLGALLLFGTGGAGWLSALF